MIKYVLKLILLNIKIILCAILVLNNKLSSLLMILLLSIGQLSIFGKLISIELAINLIIMPKYHQSVSIGKSANKANI